MISDCCASSNYCSSNVPISDAVNCIVHRLYNVACKLQIHNTITTHITHTQALSSVFIHTNIYSKVYINLYRATCAMPLMRSRDDLSYGITQCYLPTDRGDFHAFTPAYCRYSFIDPGRMKGWVDLGGWLTKMVYPQTVTHPSTNRARRTRRVTTSIETNALPLSQATTCMATSCWLARHCLTLLTAEGSQTLEVQRPPDPG